MDWPTWIAMGVAVAAPLVGGGLWIYLASSPRGEDYLKQRMQGPFVPVDSEEK